MGSMGKSPQLPKVPKNLNGETATSVTRKAQSQKLGQAGVVEAAVDG